MHKSVIIYILQIATIYNAISDGWHIRRINNKSFEFSKKISNCNEFDLNCFIDKLLLLNKTKVNQITDKYIN
jgi:hypothetical protein